MGGALTVTLLLQFEPNLFCISARKKFIVKATLGRQIFIVSVLVVHVSTVKVTVLHTLKLYQIHLFHRGTFYSAAPTVGILKWSPRHLQWQTPTMVVDVSAAGTPPKVASKTRP